MKDSMLNDFFVKVTLLNTFCLCLLLLYPLSLFFASSSLPFLWHFYFQICQAKGTGKKYLSNLDKEIIQHGILHSQKKFDSLDEYAKKGEVEEYKNILVMEVKKHYAEEKGETE